MRANAELGRATSIGGILHLRPGEAAKVCHFAFLGLLLQLGLGIGFSAGDALFIVNVGSKSLPVIFVLTPLVMLCYTPLFSWLGNRFGMQRASRILVAAIAGTGCLLFVLIEHANIVGGALYYCIKLYLAVLYISIYSAYWLTVEDFFVISDAKRLYPLFSVGCSVGTAAGAGLVSALADWLPIGAFFLIWALIAALTIPVLLMIPRLWSRIPDGHAQALHGDGEPGFLGQQARTLRSFLESPFALLLAAMMFLGLMISNVIEYQYSSILETDRTEVQLVTTIGRLYAASHMFNIIIGLFVFTPMVRRLGVKNVALILPSVYMATFILLFVSSGFTTAAIAFLAYHSVLTSIEYNNQNLLFNALPAQNRRGLRSMIEGQCEPLASCVSGLFLLGLQELWGLRQIAGITLLVAALLLAAAFGVRHAYPAAMSRNMRFGWLDLGAARRLRFPREDEDSISILIDAASRPASSCSAEALEMLMATAPERALPVLLRAIADWSDEWTGQLEALLARLLEGGDERLLMHCLTELLRLAAAGNPIARKQLWRLALQPTFDGGSFDAAMLADLRDHCADGPHARASALAHVSTMLGGEAAERRAAAELLGLLGDPKFECQLIKLLEDGDELVRAASLSALQQLTRGESARVADAVLGHFDSFSRSERTIAFAILDVAANAEQLGAILDITPMLSPTETREAEDILTGRGPIAVPGLVLAVSDRTAPHSNRRLAARALSRLSLKHLEAIKEEVVALEIGLMEEFDRRIVHIGTRPDECGLLVDYYNQKIRGALEFALEVLTLVGDLPDFDLVATSLQSSSAKVRANALETINSSLDAATFGRIARVIEPSWPGSRDDASQAYPKSMVVTVLEQAVAEGDELESAVAADALARLKDDGFQAAVRGRLLKGDAALVGEVLKARAGLKPCSRIDLLRRARLQPVFAATRFETVLALLSPEMEETGDLAALQVRAADLAPSHSDLAFNMLKLASEPT